jgi:DNA mismatch endonuclease (patch repair protein)
MPDNLTREQRSYCMSRVRNRDTDLERILCSLLQKRGIRFRKHVKGLAGRPDIVFPKHQVAVFIDGDFWHGFRFPAWQQKVSSFWRSKIALNRARDRRNFKSLRKAGWSVLRIWQHQIKRNSEHCVERIVSVLEESARGSSRALIPGPKNRV